MSHVNLPPRTLRDARLLAVLSGLLHDIGKLTAHFQNKLIKPPKTPEGKSKRDSLRHEWLSAWLLQHMLRHDALSWDGFLAAWQDWERNGVAALQVQSADLNKCWRPFDRLHSFDSSALMVVGTHHRLFSVRDKGEKSGQAKAPDLGLLCPPRQHHLDDEFRYSPESDWHRVAGWASDPTEQARWQALLADAQARRDDATQVESAPYWHKVGLIARAAMILADHHVSARSFQDETYGPVQAYANANGRSERSKQTRLNQPLTWHLGQVGLAAEDYTAWFNHAALPALSAERRVQLSRHAGTVAARFAWQDAACTFVRQQRERQREPQAFLVFNVASTGAGKTRANLRALEACRAPGDPLRVTAGFNLRTLTLQTASAYQRELGLSDDDCACVVGDPLARALHLYEELDDTDDAEVSPDFSSTGCDSEAFLAKLPEWVRRLDREADSHAQASLLGAPVLVATMDYLVAAGDPTRQAHHAHALLRLAHADLLIDEADSYDPEGLIAVLRVVQMAGMFGRNVLVSSATLSPVLAAHIERAWQSGLTMHRADPAAPSLPSATLLLSNLGSAQGTQLRHAPEEVGFADWYTASMARLYRQAGAPPHVHRLCQIVDVSNKDELWPAVRRSALQAHAHHHSLVAHHGRSLRLSVGLVRMANVGPLQELADWLIEADRWPSGTAVRICPYHGREVAMRRHLKEQALDSLLKRGDDPDLSRHPAVAQALSDLPTDAENLLFIVLASPIEEVGRDHDFDWAVIEPSSLHAIIQLAGRVNRHRLLTVMRPNVFLLDVNVRYLEEKPICFTRPGLQQHVPNDETMAATHLHPHARHLMQVPSATSPLVDAFVLDAGLVFDPTRRCRFAEEDDRAIQKLLENAEAFFQPEHEQWACDWFYLRYPLREAEASETWRVIPTVNGRLELQKHQNTIKAKRQWTTLHSDSHEERPDNEAALWLSPDLYDADNAMFAKLDRAFGHANAYGLLEQARQFAVRAPLTRDKTCIVPRLSWAGIRTQK